jgi:SSS family solute:Na+ symporter
MSAAAAALTIIALIAAGTIVFGMYAVRRIRIDPQEYIVGSRSFGALLLWVLIGGEVYTSFTFLGAAGWAYAHGAAAFYILAYLPLGYLGGYFFFPFIWRIGKARGLLTWPDFFIDRYGSKALGTAIAIVQFVLIVPYVTLQLTGLQIILTIAGYGQYNATVAVAVAFGLITLFVFTTGLRGAAWASIIKDTLVLGAALFAGIFLPIHFFGSPAAMISHVIAVKPQWFTLNGGVPLGTAWFATTVVLNAIGYFMFPGTAQVVFSARDEATVRRNMIYLPLYTIMVSFVLLAGFAAMLIVPGLKGPAADQSFLLVTQRYFAPWVVGIVCAAGSLAALLPASGLLLSAAAVASRNVLGHTRWVRPAVLLCAVLAFCLWFFAKTSLVGILLLVYNGITQLAPGAIFGVVWKRVNAWAVAAGIAAGEAIAIYAIGVNTLWWGINTGLIALAVNVAVCVAVTLLLPQKAADQSSPADAESALKAAAPG